MVQDADGPRVQGDDVAEHSGHRPPHSPDLLCGVYQEAGGQIERGRKILIQLLEEQVQTSVGSQPLLRCQW